ncbi:MAG TPA: hypothetical protein VGC99_20140 [Candidatus Tectomicrobia bacterium]
MPQLTIENCQADSPASVDRTRKLIRRPGKGLPALAGIWAGDGRLLALLAFLINAYLISAFFLPNLSEINAWDEAAYVNSGRMLVEGEWPAFAGNPLVALFYGLTYLPFAGSPFWLIHSISLARLILFTLLWLCSYAVARQAGGLAHPLIMVGLLFVSSIPVSLLIFPSDPLFVAMAALAFSRALVFQREGGLRNLTLAGLCLGLAALARNDGLIVGLAFLLAMPLVAPRESRRWKVFVASAIPFAGLVGGYVLAFGVLTGRFELGTLERTYDNFEAGHQIIFGGEGNLNPVIEAKLEARRVFGTPEDNRNSVLLAISRNPEVYLSRLEAVVRGLPAQVLAAYGKRTAVPIFLFAARGVWELLRTKRYLFLGLGAIWTLPVLSGLLITLFRTGHLQFPFYVIFLLSAVGVASSLANLEARGEQTFLAISLLGFAGYGIFMSKPAITYAAVVVIGALSIGLFARVSGRPDASTRLLPLLLLFASGLLLHGDYPGPKQRILGVAADEQAVLLMVEEFEPGTRVAAGSPGPIYAARMTYMGLTSLDVPMFATSEEFLVWADAEGIKALYVDSSLSYDNPHYWQLISSEIGRGLERIFAGDEGNIQVLVMKD